MADYIEIDTAALNRDRETIQSELEKVRTEMNRLQEKMVHLGGMWEGPAHNAFMEQFRSDYEFIQVFGREIDAYIETMQYAQSEYQKCEASIQQVVAAVKV